jgi:hypothetical protein
MRYITRLLAGLMIALSGPALAADETGQRCSDRGG